jgi:hypothetical protein
MRLGGLDYQVYLQELDKLGSDAVLMLEHLQSEGDYALAADYVRSVAAEIRVTIQ